MIKKKDFLKEYNIEKETLKKTGMKWEELNSIYDSYCRIEPQLKKIGKDFVNDYLYDIEKAGIHSYRYRTKKQVICWRRSFAKRVSSRTSTSTSTGRIIINT